MLSKIEFTEAVQLHSDGLFRYMLKLVKDKAMAENWVQDAYTALWENRERGIKWGQVFPLYNSISKND